jgi:primosomal protein N' (replication factor Y)
VVAHGDVIVDWRRLPDPKPCRRPLADATFSEDVHDNIHVCEWIRMTQYADVAVPLGVRDTFCYSIPATLVPRAAVGCRALVPFGRKLMTGFIVRLLNEPPSGEFRLRAIRDVLDPEPLVPAALVETALWISEYYFTPPGEVLRAVLPPGMQVEGIRRIRLEERTARLFEGGFMPTGLSAPEMRLVEALGRHGAMTEPELAGRSGLKSAARWIDSLVHRGLAAAEVELGRPRVEARKQLGIRGLPAESGLPLTGAQQRLYGFFPKDGSPVALQDVLRKASCGSGVARALVQKGLAEIAPLVVSRVPADLAPSAGHKSLVLTGAQQNALEELRLMLGCGSPVSCLIHGVTGSGKTEIYLRLIREAVRAGHSALLLVPEIGLTPLLSRIAVSHFPEKVALLHSGMSDGERFDQWMRIRNRGASIVVGTRSAVFAPLENLRLIVIDEEQDASYKQDESPCYHAREVAWHRILQSGGLLLMGSATPSIETYHAASAGGAMRILNLPERVEARPLAAVAVVDMGQEFQRQGRKTVLSELLQSELKERIGRREQSIILLNRRGFSRTLLCRSCGHVFSCPDCSISLTWHRADARLVCHYCGREEDTPAACSECRGPYIYYTGIGTEQLEQVVHDLCPSARLARIDRDTARRRGSLRKTLLDFAAGDLDILVGTQMVAKGHDFPNVTLVGVLAADAGLAFPDFRSAERTFQLLTQVAGRAGRGDAPGLVVIQSMYPDHYAIEFARGQNYRGFFDREVEFRKLMGYPPFKSLVQILVSHESYMHAFQIGESIARQLKSREGDPSALHVLGPAPAPIEKLKGQYRVQLLLKASSPGSAITLLRDAFEALAAGRLPMQHVKFDVDPLSLL